PLNHLNNRLDGTISQIRLNLESKKTHLETLQRGLISTLKNNVLTLEKDLENLNYKLSQLDPANRLKNGFLFAETSKKKPITSIQDVNANDTIKLVLKDGTIEAEIKYVNKKQT
ncbi:MAG: exodeoxyribonuclease VII large subunit, partial [Candidatus Margulisiibacteriota bacterium]|nr:exodeoxyribonuclease VII large subunit [Candidatus Margulisiibacteriota bacterium]